MVWPSADGVDGLGPNDGLCWLVHQAHPPDASHRGGGGVICLLPLPLPSTPYRLLPCLPTQVRRPFEDSGRLVLHTEHSLLNY